ACSCTREQALPRARVKDVGGGALADLSELLEQTTTSTRAPPSRSGSRCRRRSASRPAAPAHRLTECVLATLPFACAHAWPLVSAFADAAAGDDYGPSRWNGGASPRLPRS